MKKLNIGLIGLGRIYPRHIDDSIKQNKYLKLVAVSDIDQTQLDKISKKENVKGYLDYKALVKDKNVDVVAIASPNGLHHEMASFVAMNDKHCVLEKPISLNYNNAKILVQKFHKSKGTLFPVLQVRYNPVIRVVKEFVDMGKIGKILTASIIIRWTRPQEYFDESTWKGSAKMDGGSLLTQAIHYIDVMYLILGEPKKVFGKVSNKLLDIEVEDSANAILEFKSGTTTNLEFTINTYPQNLECSLALLGEKGSIKIGGNAMNTLEIWNVKDTPKPNIPVGLEPNIYAKGMYTGSCPNHHSIYTNMVNVLIHKKTSFIRASDALGSLKIIDAIKQSSKEKKEIQL